MIVSLRHFLGWLVSWLSCRADLVLENMALRRQLLALHAQRPRRRWTALHKLFWVALRMCWSAWRQPLVLVTPRTVVNWHRAGFRLYWTWVTRIRQVGGRKRVSKEVRALIFRTVAENPTWGAPRIHGELLKLGFDLGKKLFLVKSLCQLHPFLRCRNTSLHPRDVRHWNKRCGTQILLPWPGGWHRLPAETQPLAASDKRA